jgi:hypothetical protein
MMLEVTSGAEPFQVLRSVVLAITVTVVHLQNLCMPVVSASVAGPYMVSTGHEAVVVLCCSVVRRPYFSYAI